MTNDQPIAAPEATAADPRPARLSKGEVLFDALVYGPMNIIGTFLLTIPVAWSIEHGWGRKPFNWARDKLTQSLKINEGLAKNGLNTTSLMMGGNLMLFPVRWAENRKVDIVAGFNRMLGDRSPEADTVREPQQDWGSLIKSRSLAWFMVFASFVGIEKMAGKEKIEAIENGFAKRMCARFGWKETEMAMVDGVMKERSTRAFGYSKIAALDVFATVAAGALLYVGSRFFAKKREERRLKRDPDYRPTNSRTGDGREEAAEITQDTPQRTEHHAPETVVAGQKELSGLLAAVPSQQALLSQA